MMLDVEQILKARRDRDAMTKQFVGAIKGDDFNDFWALSEEHLDALAIAIERCTADEVALFIVNLNDSINERVSDARSDGYRDGQNDCDCDKGSKTPISS